MLLEIISRISNRYFYIFVSILYVVKIDKNDYFKFVKIEKSNLSLSNLKYIYILSYNLCRCKKCQIEN